MKDGVKVIVAFDEQVPLAAQGEALLALEKILRGATGLDVRVTKKLQQDDSRLRVMMTPEMRARL